MATKERTRVSGEVIEKAYKEIEKYEKKHGFKRGELKPFLKKVADKYEISWFSLKNKYYKKNKDEDVPLKKSKKPVETKSEQQIIEMENVTNDKENEVEENDVAQTTKKVEIEPKESEAINKNPYSAFINLDEQIEESSSKPAERIFQMPKDYYKVGQLVKVKVANIQSYGAFVEIMDGRGFQALCHISELVDGFIKKVTDYVNVDDVFENVKIIMIDNKRMNVTLKHLNLKKKEETNSDNEEDLLPAENPPVNVIGEKFSSLKDKLMERVVITTGNNAKEIDEIFAQELLSESEANIVKKYERDIEQMTSYLQDELGALTPQAKLQLAKIIDENGVFNTTRGILKTQENFKADIGLLFMQQMKSKIGDYL